MVTFLKEFLEKVAFEKIREQQSHEKFSKMLFEKTEVNQGSHELKPGKLKQAFFSSFVCLLILVLYIPVNNFSVMLGLVLVV